MKKDDFEVIDLDETANWSKLDIDEQLTKKKSKVASKNLFMNEIGYIDNRDDIPRKKHQDAGNTKTVHHDIGKTKTVHHDTGKTKTVNHDTPKHKVDKYEASKKKNHKKKTDETFFSRMGDFLSGFTAMDKLVASTGVLVLAVAIVTLSVYTSAKAAEKQIEAMAPIGEELQQIGIAGQDTLLALSTGNNTIDEFTEESTQESYEENEDTENGEVSVSMVLTSVQKDLKIKFINKKSKKLVSNVPFTVNIKDADGKSYSKEDDDQDGIIYFKDMTPGEVSVSMEPLSGDYKVTCDSSAQTVTVKEKIDYKKIDVADEVKKESQVNAKVEDTAVQNTVEATLKDTITWVESSKTAVGSKDGYEEVKKSSITDPSTTVRSSFVRMVSNNDSDVAVTGVSLSSSTLSMTVGSTQKLSASVEPSGATNKTVTWGSSDSSVATVDSNGNVNALSAGNATITATSNNDKSAKCTVTVKAVAKEVTAVSVVAAKTTIKVNENITITAKITPEDATDKTVTWKSSDTTVATIDATTGKVTGLKAGKTTITATTTNNKTDTCEITVTTDDSLSLDKTTATVVTGSVITLTATSNGKVEWSTSDKAVATVTDKGNTNEKYTCEITGVKAGTSTITAKVGSKTVTCTVTVKVNSKDDKTTLLKDNAGNPLYYKGSDGKYYEAKVADYYIYSVFYKKTIASEYKYTGWQEIDGKTYFFNADGNKITGEQVIQGAKYNFASDGSLVSGSGTLGIDVSKWNGNINWSAVKNSGISYVIIRCGYRGSTTGALIEDPKFKSNIQGATQAGLKVGIYFFTQAVNEVEAVEEASMTVGLIRNYRISYPVFLDVEGSGGRADGLDAGTRTNVIKAYCETIRNSGYTAGVYANKTWLSQKMNAGALSSYKIWLAQYNTAPTYAGKIDLWQYTSKGSVSGVGGSTDMNLSYLGY